MRIPTLNQLFGMLALSRRRRAASGPKDAVAYEKSAETALAHLSLSTLLLKREDTGRRAPPGGQGPGDMMPIS